MKIEITYEQLNWLRQAMSDSLLNSLLKEENKNMPHRLQQDICVEIEKLQKDISNCTPEDSYEPREYSLSSQVSAIHNLRDHIDDELWKEYDKHMQSHPFPDTYHATFEEVQNKEATRERRLKL
jgi:hypothetical protein